jgi:general secretion pathway protein N
MKKKFFILSILFIFFLLMLAPAKIIKSFMPQQAQINLDGLSGSIWSGKINQISTANFNLSNVEYQLNPFALFLAKLSVSLKLSDQDIKGNLAIKLSSNYANYQTIENANLTINSNLFSHYLPMANTQINGEIVSRGLNIIMVNKKPELIEGELRWNQANVNINGKDWALGTLAVKLETDQTNGDIKAQILPTENALDIKGNIKLSRDGIVEFIGSISTDTEQQLYQTFALFNNGKPANGRLPIKFRQKLL